MIFYEERPAAAFLQSVVTTPASPGPVGHGRRWLTASSGASALFLRTA